MAGIKETILQDTACSTQFEHSLVDKLLLKYKLSILFLSQSLRKECNKIVTWKLLIAEIVPEGKTTTLTAITLSCLSWPSLSQGSPACSVAVHQWSNHSQSLYSSWTSSTSCGGTGQGRTGSQSYISRQRQNHTQTTSGDQC